MPALLAGLLGHGLANSAQAPASRPATDAAPARAAAPLPPPDGAQPAFALLSLLIEPAALDEPLVTDRPDFTESTDAIPRGHVQLESGYTFTYDRAAADRVRQHEAPELLLRLGVADRTELRLGWPGYVWSSLLFEDETRAGRRVVRADDARGAADATFGAKYKFLEQDGLIPHFGLIAELGVPSGSADFSAGDVEPAVKFLWAYDLNDRLALAGNVNLAVPPSDSGRFLQTSASLSIGAALTDALGGYAEYIGVYPADQGEDCAHSLNGGLSYQFTPSFQIDCRAGFGLNDQADDFFCGVGFAWRW
ncbi:MAG: hypothetical protein CHACPFDD_01487 [Phycisphaerae bacterium]|nr:hypothetical protein [Phycisphaerae bacterium]